MHAPRRPVTLGLLALLSLLGPGPARAHFVLQAPESSYQQDFLGDPQKAPPCGDDGGAVATNMVTALKAGDILTITIDETIFHPGHYRVALAVGDVSELPEEPPVTPNNTPCGTVPIMDPPVFPVLADGELAHTEPFAGPQSFEIEVPDGVTCDKCTIQVIQFMSNHGLNNPGGCFYHHCATVSIEPSGGTTTSGGSSTTEGGGSSGEGTTTSTTGGGSSGVTVTAGGSEGMTGGGSSGGGTSAGGSSTDATSDASSTGPAGGETGGCGCSGGQGGPGGLAALLGLLGLRARRRRGASA